MNYQQIDLFSDSYKSLQDLLELVFKLNPTGGFYDNDRNKPIPPDYYIDFYKDLAFIVEFRNETDNNEKIIDNAIYLQHIGNDLYKIYEIDGKVFGRLGSDNAKHLKLVQALVDYMVNGEVFKK